MQWPQAKGVTLIDDDGVVLFEPHVPLFFRSNKSRQIRNHVTVRIPDRQSCLDRPVEHQLSSNGSQHPTTKKE